MKKLFLVAALTSLMSMSALSQENIAPKYVGEVFTFAGSFCPQGSLKADGQLLNIGTDTPLFSLLGTQFGGDGETTFSLPNLKEQSEKTQLTYCVVTGTGGIYPNRD